MSLMAAALAQGNLVAGAYVPVDPDADAYLDFVGGVYELARAQVLVTDLLGGGFDPSAITASGMLVGFANSNRPLAIGGLLTAFATGLSDGMTVLFEMDTISVGTNGGWLFSANDVNGTQGLYISSEPSGSDFFDFSIANGSVPEVVTPGITRFGFTLARDLGGGSWRQAMSANGSSVASTYDAAQNVTYALGARFDPSLDGVAFGDDISGNDPNGYQYFRKIILYPPMDDAALETLTAL